MKISASHGSAGRIFCGAGESAVRREGLGTGRRIATGGVRTGDDRSRKNLRVIPRPVRRLVVGSEPSAASGRGSEVSEWPRSKFPASAVRQRRNFGHRNRVIRNTPAQRSRRTDCHGRCAHWLRNDMVFCKGVRCKSGWADGLLVVRWREVQKRQRGGAAFMLFRPGSP